jgi:hypothetical protein
MNPSKNGSDSENSKSSTNLSKVPSGKLRRRQNEALKRLGVTRDELKAAPSINAILKETRGGKAVALEAMRFASSSAIATFLEKYDSIPTQDRARLPFEAIAIAAKVDLIQLLGEIIIAARNHSANIYKFIAVSNHPSVIKSRVEFAKLPGGYRDRDAIDTMMGALPSPKGPTFIGKVVVGKDEEEEPGAGRFEDDLDAVFPDASLMQDRVHPMRQKLLESRK